MITLSNAVENLLKDDVIQQTYIYSYKSKKYWKLTQPITVELSNGKIISIPIGFEYDMASVPKFLWSFIRPFNDGLLGYLIHDYLYINKDKHNLTRKECDEEMLIWCNVVNHTGKFDNKLRYVFVRALGWLYWCNII